MGEVIEIKRYIKIRDRWMDKTALIQYWNISRRKIDYLIADGLPMVMRFGKRQIMLSDAEKWAASQPQKEGAAQ